jgi:hypothetical protein
LPERVAFFDTLPLSGFGKVSKKELAAILSEPKGAGPAWTEERRGSDEGRQGLKGRSEASEGQKK